MSGKSCRIDVHFSPKHPYFDCCDHSIAWHMCVYTLCTDVVYSTVPCKTAWKYKFSSMWPPLSWPFSRWSRALYNLLVTSYVVISLLVTMLHIYYVGISYLLLLAHVAWYIHKNHIVFAAARCKGMLRCEAVFEATEITKFVIMVFVFRLFSSCMCCDPLETRLSSLSSADKDASVLSVQHRRMSSGPW